MKALGLGAGVGVSFGLCIVTATPSVDDCTPGTTHQTAPDHWGNLSTSLTFERFLLIEDTLIDCAKTQCELRLRVFTPASGAVEVLHEPLVFADSPTRGIDLGGSDSLEHRVPREMRITGLDDSVSDNKPIVEQCVRTTQTISFGTPYEACVSVAITDLQRDHGQLRATITASRWGYDVPGLAFGNPTLIDCSLASLPCYLRVGNLGHGGYTRRPLRVVGDGAGPPKFETSKTTGLVDGETIELTLRDMPPRRWGYLLYCLDRARQQAVPPADGDGLTGCVRLLEFPGRTEAPGWPASFEQMTLDAPRFIEWAGTTHDCADPRGCDLTLITGSDLFPDFGYQTRLTFAP